MCLIAETSWLSISWSIFQVVVGLGAVIFVHELGHFLVAKACGVQCDKFYVGFDVPIRLPMLGRVFQLFGLQVGGEDGSITLPGALVKRTWGETEYGIGMIPLGGYVKMLGQDDNPARAAEELERARIAQQESSGEGESEYVLDPRSYLAKSVPQRMAIISAGVVMNVIFAFLFAVVAYSWGVEYLACGVSSLVPGSPAWQSGIEPGGTIVRLNDLEHPRFRDLQQNVSLADLDHGVEIGYLAPGESQPTDFLLRPRKVGDRNPTIGVMSLRSLKLLAEDPFQPETPAAAADPQLQGGDVVIEVNGTPVTSHHEYMSLLVRNMSQPVTITAHRNGEANANTSASNDGETITTQVAPRPMQRLGLVMRLGKVAGVQDGSPASAEGVQVGDLILAIDGQPVPDPIALPQYLQERASRKEAVELTVRRASGDADEEPERITIPLREPTWWNDAVSPGTPLDAAALGICYRVLNRVDRVEPGSPADRAGIRTGYAIVAASFVPAEDDESAIAKGLRKLQIEFDEANPNWPFFMNQLQQLPPGTKIELTVKKPNGELEELAPIAPAPSSQWFVAERGFFFAPEVRTRQASSVGEAMRLAARETGDSLLAVYRFLRKLVERQISWRNLGGPITIGKVAFYSAERSFGQFLMFLTLISANLAVVNFLPIPVLDGGHMMFLLWEAVFRRPMSERVLTFLTFAGLFLVLALMATVLLLDVGFFARPG